MAKQSQADRVKRLLKGGCPIHGMGMTQVGILPSRGRQIDLVECCRKDCSIQATVRLPDTEATLLPRFSHLIGD
jgi:hypothetical protein